MKVVYVAGPYRSKFEYYVKRNIDRAEEFAVQLMRLGICVICPQKNFSSLNGCTGDDNIFMLAGLELVKRSDAVFVVDTKSEKGETSYGTLAEIELAKNLGIPVFYRMSKVEDWLSKEF